VGVTNFTEEGFNPLLSYKPPADCRGAQLYFVMLRMTRAPQQERWGVLEMEGRYEFE